MAAWDDLNEDRDAGVFGLLREQLAQRQKLAGKGADHEISARTVSGALAVSHRYGSSLGRALSSVRQLINPADTVAYDESFGKLEYFLISYLSGAYSAAEGAPRLVLPSLRDSVAAAERAAFELAAILARASLNPPEGRAPGLLGGYSTVATLKSALDGLLEVAVALVTARHAIARDLEPPASGPSYAAARQREYRHRRASKAKRVRLDVYPEDERLLAALGFLAPGLGDNPSALSDAVQTLFLAALLSYPGDVSGAARLAAQKKRLVLLGSPSGDSDLGAGSAVRKKRVNKPKRSV